MPHILKFSTLLILSQFVFLSHQLQQCLGTLKQSNSDFTFALAHVEDFHNPLAAQEACYYSCGAQIVTQSSNRGDMSRLTLMDNAASLLTATGFLTVGESYFLNHLGMEDDEGGNGIGCIQVKPGNRINHFPKSHPVCTMAKAAVCGFWGQQSIPAQPSGMLPITAAPQPTTGIAPPVKPVTTSIALPVKPVTTSIAPPVKPVTTSIAPPLPPPPKTTSVIPSPLEIGPSYTHPAPEATKILPEIETVTDLFPFIDEPTPLPSKQQPGAQFSVNGRNFNVVNKNEGSLAAASAACQNNQATIATVTSENLQAASDKLKEMGHSKIIIGSWNGDSYSLTGTSCLIMNVEYGIYPGICTEASSILCQL